MRVETFRKWQIRKSIHAKSSIYTNVSSLFLSSLLLRLVARMNTSFVFFFIFFLLRFVSSAPEAISSDLSLDKTRVSDASAPEPVAIPDLVLHEQATHLKARHCPPYVLS